MDKTKSELHDLREELERSQSQLDEVLGELEQTHFELHQLKEKGGQQQSESDGQVKQELEETKAKWQDTEQLLEKSQSQKELEEVQAKWQQNQRDESRLFKINNAVVKPIEIKSNHEWIGGVCFPENMPGVFRHRRSGKLVDKNEPIYIDKAEIVDNSREVNVINNTKNKTYNSNFPQGTYIYGGPLYLHFGHILTESIHRIWAFNHKLHDLTFPRSKCSI